MIFIGFGNNYRSIKHRPCLTSSACSLDLRQDDWAEGSHNRCTACVASGKVGEPDHKNETALFSQEDECGRKILGDKSGYGFQIGMVLLFPVTALLSWLLSASKVSFLEK